MAKAEKIETREERLARQKAEREAVTDEIRQRLEQKPLEMAIKLLGPPTYRSRLRPRWGKKGSFRLDIATATWLDFETKEHGDMFALIKREKGSFREAKEWARSELGLPNNYRADTSPTKADQRRRERKEKKARETAQQILDQARRIEKAQGIWRQTRPLTGTPGEIYLRLTRAIAARAWPDSIRWSDHHHAVVVAITDEAGEIVAVQMIAVTKDGQKDLTRWHGRAKQTEGVLERGVLRLPGPADGTLCVAEGPETAATIWAATGRSTIAMCGALKRVAEIVPAGRRIILCIDDDPRGAQSVRGAKAAKDSIAARGGDVHTAWPFATRRFNKQDFNDLAQESGLDAVRHRIDIAAIDQNALRQILLSLTQAESRIDQHVREFFEAVATWREGDATPVHALNVTVGVGKTQAAVKYAIPLAQQIRNRGDVRPIIIAVPAHRLSRELETRSRGEAMRQNADIKVAVWRGRNAAKPDGDGHMCDNLEEVHEAERLAVSITKEICKTCPKREACAYLAQFGLEADIWIVAHQMLFKAPPTPIGKNIAAVVVDEDFRKAGLVGVERGDKGIPLDFLERGLPQAPGDDGMWLDDVRRTVAAALRAGPDGPVSQEALMAFGITDRKAGDARRREWDRKIETGPWRERKDNASLGMMSTFWQAVEGTMKPGAPARSGWLTVGYNKEGVRIVRVTGRKDIAEAWRVPTLAVDGTLDVDLIRPYWPSIEDKGTLKVGAPHQTIRQVISRSYSKGFLAGDKPVQKLRAQILRQVRELRAEGRTLIITNKDVEARLDLLGDIVTTAHFNDIAGRDEWRNVRLLIIIGRTLPPPLSIEREAAALTGAAVETLSGFYQRRDDFRIVRTAGGIKRLPATRDAHPDPTADRILQQTVQGELTQAIGRARGVRRTADNPVDVLVFGDVILAEPVDELLTDDDVAVTQADRMLAAGGIAFDEPRAAAAAYRELYRTHEAAKKAMQRQSLGTNSYENISYVNVPHLARIAFQREGAGQRRQFATIDTRRVPDARAELERIFGPLAQFEMLDVPQPAEEPARPIMLKVANGTPQSAARPMGGNLAPVAYVRPPDLRDNRQQPEEPP